MYVRLHVKCQSFSSDCTVNQNTWTDAIKNPKCGIAAKFLLWESRCLTLTDKQTWRGWLLLFTNALRRVLRRNANLREHNSRYLVVGEAFETGTMSVCVFRIDGIQNFKLKYWIYKHYICFLVFPRVCTFNIIIHKRGKQGSLVWNAVPKLFLISGSIVQFGFASGRPVSYFSYWSLLKYQN
jgi:hypothetical protein